MPSRRSGTIMLMLAVLAAPTVNAAAPKDEHEPAWLDASYGSRALKWVAAQRSATLKRLQADGRFVTLANQSAEILTDPSRLEEVTFIDGAAYQYHQERDRPLGVWRRTPTTSYLSGKPDWEPVIDLDKLAAKDGKKWIFAGADCHDRRCLVRLSDDGKDSAETREFDLDSKQFVPNGFFIPDSKSHAAWYDQNTLLVAPVLGQDSINSSLLPKTLRVWRRGTPLAATKPIFSIGDHDAMLSMSFIKAAGVDGFIASRHIDFESREYRLFKLDGTSRPLPLPELASIMGVYAGKLLFRPEVDWTPPGGATFPAGVLVSVSLDALMKDARIADAEIVYRPVGDDAVRGTITGDGKLFVELLHDYYSRIVEVKRDGGGTWGSRVVPVSSGRFITSMGLHEGKLLLHEEAPLVPPQIVLADPATGAEQVLYQRAPAFHTTGLETELFHTASRDGTTIDYLITHARNMKYDGSNPTLIYGYGGYDVPVTPRYEAIFGKLWMERGGVYVHAYLRGGGEHGPTWHRGPMRQNRQQAFDDMEAVIRDVQRRRVTSPAHTGIIGRSNGGLMVATVMEQVPDLLNAVVVGGPLIDMLNYDKLPPGGTWLAEYGDPQIPAEAAWLRTYSPMQHVAGPSTHYPTPLIITATYDDRVLPGHARRFSYQLSRNGHDNLYFEDAQGGHYWELAGGPAPGDWHLRSVARAVEFTYLWDRLGGTGVGR